MGFDPFMCWAASSNPQSADAFSSCAFGRQGHTAPHRMWVVVGCFFYFCTSPKCTSFGNEYACVVCVCMRVFLPKGLEKLETCLCCSMEDIILRQFFFKKNPTGMWCFWSMATWGLAAALPYTITHHNMSTGGSQWLTRVCPRYWRWWCKLQCIQDKKRPF